MAVNLLAELFDGEGERLKRKLFQFPRFREELGQGQECHLYTSDGYRREDGDLLFEGWCAGKVDGGSEGDVRFYSQQEQGRGQDQEVVPVHQAMP